jgi:hypothetical protein
VSERRNDVFSQGAPPARRDVLREDFGLEIPVELAPLPSKGKVYPDGSPLQNATSVEIKAMTAREEDILTSRAFLKKGTVITELLKSCIHTPGVDPDSLLSGDRNAIMISLRVTGYGQEYKSDILCPYCDNRVEATFDLSQLRIKPLDLEPLQPGQNLFQFTLPVSKKVVTFKYLTGADERDFQAEMDQKKKMVGMQGESLVTSKLKRAVMSVDGITDRSKIVTFVQSMPAGDSRALRKFMDDNEPGIDMKVWTTCPLCHEGQEVEMPIGLKFFWPDG